MGFSIQIRCQGDLVVPEDSGYVPPNPDLPDYISFDFEDMKIITHVMIHAGAVDPEILKSKDKRKCNPGMVPAYKFLMNDGYVVTAKEAQLIAEKLLSQELLTDDFLRKLLPKKMSFEQALKDYLSSLITLWIPYNRVAAANDGYTVK